MKQKSLSIICSSLGGGGAERIVATLANVLPANIERSVVTLYNLPQVYHLEITSVYLVRYSDNLFLRVLNIPVAVLKYIYYLKKRNVTVSMSISPTDNLINILACIFLRKKAILCVHGMPSAMVKWSRYFSAISFNLIKHTDNLIVAVSNGVKDECIKIYNIPSEKISVIHNPIDSQSIIKLSSVNITSGEMDVVNTSVPRVITVGSFRHIKSQWHLIRSFAAIRKQMPCQLLICGDGGEREYIKSLVNELQISESVILLGWQDNPYKYMANSTVFVQSSLSEALPNVLIESMACGCPVVASDCSSGIHEIMGDDNSCGIIAGKMTGIRHLAYEPLDSGEQSLYDAIMTILKNPELREAMSQASKERAKIFDVSVGIQKYADLIESVSRSAK